MPFERSPWIEAEYRRAIQRLLLRALHIPEHATIEEILEKISLLAGNAPLLQRIGNLLSAHMVTQTATANARSWREAAMEASRGREIYVALQQEMRGPVGLRVREIVSENAELISSIPAKIRESVNLEIAGLEREGLRANEIVKHLRQRVPQLTKTRAALIARTETGKAAEALTQARSEELGIPAYVWETSRDQRVRPSHRILQGVLCFWDDPPAPEELAHEHSTLGHYGAGQAPNCRCTALPVLRAEALSWPHKLYAHGRIRYVTLRQFREFSGLRIAA